MRTILTVLLCFCSTFLKAQLSLPITWYANKQVTTFYHVVDSTSSGSVDSVTLACPLAVVLDSSSLKIGTKVFTVEAITWPSQIMPDGSPPFYKVFCKGGTIVMLWGKFIDVQYKAVQGWWKIVSYQTL